MQTRQLHQDWEQTNNKIDGILASLPEDAPSLVRDFIDKAFRSYVTALDSARNRNDDPEECTGAVAKLAASMFIEFAANVCPKSDVEGARWLLNRLLRQTAVELKDTFNDTFARNTGNA